MMHKAWRSIEEVPYCFSRSYIKFQGHTALKIFEFDPNWAFPDSNSSLNSPMAMKCCTKLETAKERCPIVFQGHPSNFKVTRDKTSPILTQIGRFWTIGRSQLSNPSDLPCFSRSSIKFEVHTGQKNTNFDLNWVFLDCNSSWIHRRIWNDVQSLMWYRRGALLFFRSSVKFQGHTGWKIYDLNPIWERLLGCSQLSNPSDLPCFQWSGHGSFYPNPIEWHPKHWGIAMCRSLYLYNRFCWRSFFLFASLRHHVFLSYNVFKLICLCVHFFY